MTLAEIEELARDWSGTHLGGAGRVARALLAALPVIRAAEQWRSEIARKPRPTDAEVELATAYDEAIDAFRGGDK